MKRYLIGFVVGICTAGSVVFAIDYSEVDFSGAHRDSRFRMAVVNIIENTIAGCIVDIRLPVFVEVSNSHGEGSASGTAYISC